MSIHRDLSHRAADLGLKLSSDDLRSFDDYEKLIIAENKKYNLVASADHEAIISHFIDSLSALTYPHLRAAKNILDIGSGVGFPAIPLKIVLTKIPLTIVESRQKRALFLKLVVARLELIGVELCLQRIEGFGQKDINREKYDIVLARAVASLNVLLEYAIPVLNVGGRLIAYKGRKKAEEIEEAKPALAALGAEIEDVISLDILPGKDRSLVVVRKLMPTPVKYPRRQGIPSKRPIK